LGANVETLLLLGNAANGTGNELDNTLSGIYSSAANTLAGGAGNDIYYAGAGDVVIENAGGGTDIVYAYDDFTLGDNVEMLLLADSAINGTGNAQDNVLFGNYSALANTLAGGAGNDVYYVGAGDKVVENAGQGQDIVYAYADHSLALGASVEYLIGLANTGMNLTGNELSNDIRGTGFNDILTGGAGADALTGGLGADTFVFTSLADSGVLAGNRDIITDFVSVTDKIDFSGIDAIEGTAANDVFTFISTDAFSGAGQLRYFTEGADTVLEGDVNGDGLADFQIQLTGINSIQTGDLVLSHLG
jgi:Ca2+-binding RTX toxin-like protein